LHRFGDRVGDQQHGLIERRTNIEQLVAKQHPGLLVERAETNFFYRLRK
jgi:hypothetical protein